MYSPSAVQLASQWAHRHHGVITRSRARALGLTDHQLDGLLARGEWRPVHRGVVVSTASPPTPHQALLAAVAAGGPGSAASHLSAAWLHGMLEAPPAQPWVTRPMSGRRKLPGIHLHRSRELPTTIRDGIPVTTVNRTLLDCAAAASPATLTGLVDRALARRLLDAEALLGILRTKGVGHHGAGALLAHLTDRGFVGGPSPSVLESRFGRLIDDAGLPEPVREHHLVADGHDRYLDTAYPGLHLAFEVDGYAYHSSPEQAARDHARRNAITRLGWTVVVFTWRDVTRHPDWVVAELKASYGAALERVTAQGALH